MSRFYLFLLCVLLQLFSSEARAQAEIGTDTSENEVETSIDSEVAAPTPMPEVSSVSDLSVAPIVPQAAFSDAIANAGDAELYDPQELNINVEDGIEIVSLKDGTPFFGAVKLPNETNQEMIYFYKNGKKNGTAIAYDDNHNVLLEISYKDGLKNGVEILFYPNGKPQYQKTYKDGKLNGEEILFFENGKPSKRIVYTDDVLNGEVRTFTSEGNLTGIENYTNGVKHGVEQIIENNRLKQENVYINGKLDGLTKKFNEKYLIEEIPYKNGLQEGIHKIYSEKGGVSEIPYVAGKREGLATVYFPNKQPAQKVQYFNDMKNGLNEKFHKDGTISASEYYKDDKLEGLSRYFDKKGYLAEVKYYVDGTEMASVNLETDSTLKNIYNSYKQDKFGKYSSKRNLWYTVLWLALNTGNEDMLSALEKEMKMYALSLDDMIAYKKYSEDFEDLSRRLYFGLTPFGYAVNLSAPTEILQRFISQAETINPRGTTPLQEAIRLNKPDMVKYILLQTNVSETQPSTDTLFYALKNNAQPAIIEALLQSHPDLSATNESGDTPLLYALKNQHRPKTIISLLKAGAQPTAADDKGNTPLYYAVRNQMPSNVMQQMLQAGANIDATDCNGDTALIYEIRNNYDSEQIASLIRIGANVNATDAKGFSPLAAAVAQKREDIVRLLIEAGAKLNSPLNTAEMAQTPILMYAYSNQTTPEIMQILLKSGADINQQDARGNTLLLTALHRQDEDFAQNLLAQGADVNLQTTDGESALTYVLSLAEYTPIRDSVLAHNADLNQKMPNTQNQIWHYLLQTRNAELIKTAFDNVSDFSQLKDDNGWTPVDEVMLPQYTPELKDLVLAYVSQTDSGMLERALQQKDSSVLQQVIELNKDPKSLQINGENLLVYVIKNRLNPSHLDVLSQIGIDFDEPDTSGQTALGLCVAANEEQYVPYLLKYGADVNKIVSDRSYLMNLQGHQTELTQLLIQQKPDISHVTESGETTLMAAAKNGNKPLLEYLLRQGADIDAEDNDGNNALMYLAQRKNTIKQPSEIYQDSVTDIVSLLLKSGIDVNHRNINGETALILFAKHNAEIYQALRARLSAEGAEIDLKDQYSKTADDYFALNSKK